MKTKFLLLLFTFITSFLVAQNNNSNTELFDYYESKCNSFNKKSKFDSAQFYLKKINNIVIQTKDSSLFYRKELIEGSFFTRKGDYDIAMNKLFKAVEFFKIQKDSTHIYRGKYKIGVCNYYLFRKDKALNLMQEVLDNSKFVTEKITTSASANIGAIILEKGIVAKDKNLVNKSISYFKHAIILNKKNEEFTNLASNYSLLAECFIQLDNKKQALLLLDSAIYFAKKDANLTEEGFALIKKADVLYKNKKYEEALIAVEKAIIIYRESDNIPVLIYAFIEKKHILENSRNFEEASKQGDSIYTYSLLGFNKRFADGISEMETKYKTAKKEREILVQRADLAENGLLIQKQNYQIYGIIGIALLFLILGLFLYNFQKTKNRQLIKENELKQAVQKIETHNKLQEQRLRISRDLHDNIGAQLSFIISSIDNLKFLAKDKDEKYKDKLTYISQFTSNTINQLRDTIWAMNKNEITLEDLQSRIMTFIEKAKIANETVNFTLNNSIKSSVIFTSIKGINIFRIIQESINNSLKYSGATEINIDLFETETQLKISVKDNGKGFDKNTITPGNGLINMKERMDEINGELEINSSEKEGTSIVVSCIKEATFEV